MREKALRELEQENEIRKAAASASSSSSVLMCGPSGVPPGALLLQPASAPSSSVLISGPAGIPPAMPSVELQTAVILRRLTCKQSPPKAYLLARGPDHAISAQARADEAIAEVTALELDAQRKRVHYTHIRTNRPLDRQPDSFPREGFYKHLEMVYAEFDPEISNPSGSILSFGAAAKELHAAAAADETRHEHHDATTYTSRRH